MKKTILHPATEEFYKFLENSKEVPKGSSQTIPDQSITIAELVQRYQNGQVVSMYQNNADAVYNADFTVPNVEKLDFTDIENFRKEFLSEKIRVENLLSELDADKDGKPDVIDRLTNVLESLDKRQKQLSEES